MMQTKHNVDRRTGFLSLLILLILKTLGNCVLIVMLLFCASLSKLSNQLLKVLMQELASTHQGTLILGQRKAWAHINRDS